MGDSDEEAERLFWVNENDRSSKLSFYVEDSQSVSNDWLMDDSVDAVKCGNSEYSSEQNKVKRRHTASNGPTLRSLSPTSSVISFSSVGSSAIGAAISARILEQKRKSRTAPKARGSSGICTGSEANIKLRPVNRRLPEPLEALLGQANLHFASGSRSEAFKMAEEVVRNAPTHSAGYECLQSFYEVAGDQEKQLEIGILAAHFKGYLATSEQWVNLAQLAIQMGRKQQAASCYGKAIGLDRTNTELFDAKCRLHSELNEPKAVLRTRVKSVIGLMGSESLPGFIERARTVADECHANDDLKASIECRKCLLARAKSENIVLYKDLYHYTDLLIRHNELSECITAIFDNANVRMVDRVGDEIKLGLNSDAVPHKFVLNDEFPVDLKTILCIAFIRHGKLEWSLQFLEQMMGMYNFETEGDLFFEIAEAYAHSHYFTYAEKLLKKIITTTAYCQDKEMLLRYADIIAAQSNREEDAINAYLIVLRLDSQQLEGRLNSHQIEARLKLAELQSKLGRNEDALHSLRAHLKELEGPMLGLDEEMKLIVDLNERLLYQQCLLLESQSEMKWRAYVRCALQLLAMFFKDTDQVTRRFITPVGSFYSDVKSACLDILRPSTIQKLVDRVSSPFEESIPDEEIARIFDKVAKYFWLNKRWSELLGLAAFGYCCTSLYKAKYSTNIPGLLFFVGIKCGAFHLSWLVIRNHVGVFRSEKESRKVVTRCWNGFGYLMAKHQVVRYHRFILRAMSKMKDCSPLVQMSGNNSLITGTYNHALVEYINLSRFHPTVPFYQLMTGILFIHLACRKSVSRRHDVCIQAISYLDGYFWLRGHCQEAYYNLGRTYHQLGIPNIAINLYGKVLDSNEDDFMAFNLKACAAYNLSRIYQAAENESEAKRILRSHCSF